MLTRAQIQRLAQRHNIGVQAQERDYLQHLLLFLLYNRSQALVFKGGTALRMVYRGNRYSEDLDFNGPENVDEIKSLWSAVLGNLSGFGTNAEIRFEWRSEVGYSFDVSYQGPLYDGRDRTKGKVRVDVSLRQETVEIRRELVSTEYDDIRPFVVSALSQEHLLAEKMRALVVRGKPRDVYDIWLLHNQGVQLRVELAANKLSLYNLTLSKDVIEKALAAAQKDWERDLRPLLPQFIAWEDVNRSLQPFWARLAE